MKITATLPVSHAIKSITYRRRIDAQNRLEYIKSLCKDEVEIIEVFTTEGVSIGFALYKFLKKVNHEVWRFSLVNYIRIYNKHSKKFEIPKYYAGEISLNASEKEVLHEGHKEMLDSRVKTQEKYLEEAVKRLAASRENLKRRQKEAKSHRKSFNELYVKVFGAKKP